MTPQLLIFAPIALTLGYGAYLVGWLHRQPAGTSEQIEISEAIKVGADAYLNRQYRTVGLVAVILAALLYIVLGWFVAVGFLAGAIASTASGYVGMMIAVRSNSKTTAAALRGLNPALTLAFKAGAVTGFFVVALSLLSVAVFYFWGVNSSDANALRNGLIGLSFGASLISVFARLGGGIFTKAADVGADLV
ncbi:MAG: sodium/proton-translocating pyrophosphatase, partial [Candidatus Liptonbacteria bacterium]|nr:sodium/proton-translocating pyrophosphatase [Candidatus Liptonbacteria bacterium]